MSTRKTKKQASKSGENSSSETKAMNESQFKFAFALVDTNNDGLINQEELKNILNMLGIKANDQIIQQMLIDIVKSENGLISEKVFKDMMIRYSKKAHLKEGSKEDELEKDLRAAFNVFDHDNNGHINREELRSALRMIGEKLSEKEVDKILSSIECDKDGQISYQQFVKIFI